MPLIAFSHNFSIIKIAFLKTMDHRDIHYIIGNVSKNLFCLHCKQKIIPKEFRILNVADAECVLGVVCPICKTNIMLNVVQEKETFTNDDLMKNVSTHISTHSTPQPLDSISEHDIVKIKKDLNGFKGGFSKLFKTKAHS